ncbi:MAG TPA: hypothetical protein PLX23_05325 [Candidatus Hydrogenedens sp.]|nr:hypothetical protein [Candidatus Hydrogenedens sp.]
MKRFAPILLIVISVLFLQVGLLYAQESMNLGKYSSMKIEHVGKLKGILQQGINIREMTGGVSIILLSQEPNTPNMPIKAEKMIFEWEEGRNTPVLIRMEGNVFLEHPEGKLKADKAVWDFKKETVEFTGNPQLDSPKAEGLKGSKIVLDFKNNTIDIENLQADSIPLQGEGGGASGESETGLPLLTESDILDWNRFITELKKQAQGTEMTPGKHLLNKFDANNRAQFLSVPNELILQKKRDLMKQINRLLRKPDFYNKEAWSNIALPESATELLNKGTLTTEEQVRLNRILLQAAFPNIIKPL